MSERDPNWYRLLLGWLEASLRATTVDHLGLRSTPLKLLRFPDSPAEGLTTWSTFECSDLRWPGPDVQVGYELLFCSRADVDGLSALRRAVEVLTVLERPAQPGTVLTDLFTGIEGLGVELRHAVLLPPWVHERLEPLVEGGVRVEPVQLVPATEPEIELVRQEGIAALAARWELELAPLLDPGRVSVVEPAPPADDDQS